MMTTQKRKIISLNLALLFVLLAALPTGAVETEQTSPQDLKETLLAQRLDEIAAPAEEEGAELFAQEPYLLWVGTTVFYSDQDKSGSGWTYTADDHTLTLDGYQGSGIAASGDLVIYAYGDNQVTGQDGVSYGQDGIIVDGALDINVMAGNSLSVKGGSGRSGAGKGISAAGSLDCWVSGELGAVGGDTTSSNVRGGDGLHSRTSVFISGVGAVFAMGGQAAKGMGGCGILSGFVYLGANCVIVGASGYFGGDGIYFGYDCSLSAIDGIFVGGEASSASAYNGAPIRGSEDEAVWYYHEHTTLSESDRILVVAVNEYTMNISGNGGVLGNGEARFSDTQKYPHYYDLGQFIATRDKYTQVGWQEGNEVLSLTKFFRPERNTSLSAAWIMVDPGDIVLNGLNGTFPNGERYQSRRTAVTLPTELTGTYKTEKLLGWSDALGVDVDATTKIAQGVWHAGGSVVQPDKSSVQLLYAHETDGRWVRYHPNGGAMKNGGTLMVQGTTATIGDLQIYATDASRMVAPEGCRLLGWSRAADVDAVRYKVGEKIEMPYFGEELIDLYAVWEQYEFTQEIEPGAEVTSNVDTGAVTVELTGSWCQKTGGSQVIAAGLREETNRLLRADVAHCSGQGAQLELDLRPGTPTKIKLFVLDENLAPVCPPKEITVFSQN